MKNKLKYFIRRFDFLRVYFSPFKPLKLRLHIGRISIGTPYFFPRVWKKHTSKEAIRKAAEKHTDFLKDKSFKERYDYYMTHLYSAPKKIGFDFISLGWKTKWDYYRFEWSPTWSFVFFKWQIALIFIAPEEMSAYWESWLYYTKNTDKKLSIRERIKKCREEAPQTWTSYKGEEKITTDYYNLILKKKWL